MMDQQELMQTSILSKYGKDNGYNPLSYQDFQNRCMEYWGLSLHKEPKDYVLSIWKSHTNLTHPGKYFRPSKVKIMRPTSPK